jgi:putative flavoprotein involved in K+ transport
MRERHDIVVIGGGQAGLVMSHCLRERGREHIVLERQRVAKRWHSERWDSLAFQFPNYDIRLPGYQYVSNDPEGFASYRDIARMLEDYAVQIDAPVRCGSNVTRLSADSSSSHILIETGSSTIDASHVVIATGPFQEPSLPTCAAGFPARILQVHASSYRNPAQLPEGAVLVVGSGNSGCQIVEELNEHGRRVYFVLSRHHRVPRRYRTKDVTWWYEKMGRWDAKIDDMPGRKFPIPTVLSGTHGGHDVNVRQLAADGVVLLGRLLQAAGEKLAFADDAEAILREADSAYWSFFEAADAHARASGLDFPEEPKERVSAAPIDSITSLDLAEAGIASVIWSTGYRYDYGWLKLPVLDERGAPLQRRGLTSCPNVYFLGLHWMYKFKSAILRYVVEDATYLSDHIAVSH